MNNRILVSCHIFICLVLLLVSYGLRAQQVNSTVDGIFQIVWGDPLPGVGSGETILYSLALQDGSNIPLQLKGQDNVAVHYFGKHVSVSGSVVPNQLAAANPLNPSLNVSPYEIVVDSITPVIDTLPNGQTPLNPASPSGVFGTRKVIFLLLKFSDDTAVPHPPVFYTDLTNPDTPPADEVFPVTINGFFKKTSWDQLHWIGDVGGVGGVGASGGWLTLPHPKSYYAPCGWSSSCANLNALSYDGTALGRAEGINFTNYDNINFVLSNDLDCCASGGSYYSSVDGKSYGATWEPPWGQETGTYVHEMGHSIGLPHSGWVYYAYDSPWDVMSDITLASIASCGSYNSQNFGGSIYYLSCTEPGDGYNAAYKDYLGWIPAGNEVVTSTTSVATFSLEADSLPLGSLSKMIKICITGSPCSGTTAHYFTIEARVGGLGSTSQYDNGLPGEGIIIHEFQGDRPVVSGPCFFNNQSGWAWPIDSTPGDFDSTLCSFGGRTYPDFALYNAQWNPGQTYTNDTYGFYVSVISHSGSTFVVSINSLPPASPTLVSVTPGDGSVSVSFTPGAIGSGSLLYYTASCGGIANTGNSSPIIVAGLTNGTAYTCTVKTTSTAGDSLPSEPSSSVVPNPISICTSISPADPSVFLGSSSPVLTATCSNSPTAWKWRINGYSITGCGTGSSTCTIPAAALTTIGKTYSVTVTANNSAGTGTQAASTTISVVTPPSACTAITPSNPTVGLGSASPLLTADCSNSPTAWKWRINGYSITGCGTGSSTCTIPAAALTTVGKTYTVTVTANNAAGTGTQAASTSINVVSPLSACASISPLDPSVTLGSSSPVLTASCSNSPTAWKWRINGYSITGCGTGSSTCTIPAAALTTVGKTYTVTVTANNAAGTGTQAASTSINVTAH